MNKVEQALRDAMRQIQQECTIEPFGPGKFLGGRIYSMAEAALALPDEEGQLMYALNHNDEFIRCFLTPIVAREYIDGWAEKPSIVPVRVTEEKT